MENLSKYREFLANKFLKGGYRPSSKIKKQIAEWEGSSMLTNRSFEEEAKDFNAVLPNSIKAKMTLEMLDGLFSYSYNVGANKFKERVVPSLLRLYSGQGDINEVERSMYANLDFSSKYGKGLTSRRNLERAMVHRGYGDLGDTFLSNYKYDYRRDAPIINTVNTDNGTRLVFKYPSNKEVTSPIQTYLETPIGTSYTQLEYVLPETVLESSIQELPSIELPEIEVVSNRRPTFDIPIFILDLNSFLTVLELPILKAPNAIEQQNILALEYINNLRAIQDNNILYSAPYLELLDFIYGKEYAEQKRKHGLEDLRFRESMANIAALGGLLFDPITNTINPNNKLSGFTSKSIIPQVRY